MDTTREKWMNLLMGANAFIFVVTFLSIGFYNRPSADDFQYLALTREHGVWDAMVLLYHNWNPRWASTLVVNGFFSGWQDGVTLPLLHVLTMALGWAAFAMLFKIIFQEFTIMYLYLPFYVLAGLFYVSFGTGDTWYWLCSVPMYLWGVLAVAFGFGLLIMNGGKWWRIPMVTLVFLYVGGSSETVAVCTLILLIYIGLLRGESIGPRMFHVATIACLTGLIIDAMGNGAQVRFEHLPQMPLTDRLLIALKNYGRLLLFRIPTVLPAMLAFLLPVAWMGMITRQSQVSGLSELFSGNRHGFALTDIMMLFVSLMMGLLMSDMGPDRAWLPISAAMLVLGAAMAWQLGDWLDAKLKGWLFHLALVAQVVLLGYQVGELAIELPRAMRYAEAVDDRMQNIAEAVELGDTLLALRPLPDAGWLQSAEIRTDTAHHLNRHLSLHFGGKVKLFVQDSLTSEAE
ncbi:MAG: hypothetical protein K9J06_06010 [Flavobacteriales bacterium]|nr:hypothetical protein [Flavobacteriales bacterium]